MIGAVADFEFAAKVNPEIERTRVRQRAALALRPLPAQQKNELALLDLEKALRINPT
jgi:hypothetical protein